MTEEYQEPDTLVEFIKEYCPGAAGGKFHLIHMQKVWNYQQKQIDQWMDVAQTYAKERDEAAAKLQEIKQKLLEKLIEIKQGCPPEFQETFKKHFWEILA